MNYHAAKAFIVDKLERELSADLTYHGLHANASSLARHDSTAAIA